MNVGMRRRVVFIGAFIVSFLLFKPFLGLAYASTYTSFLIYDNQYIQLIANYSGPDSEGFYTYSYTLSYDFVPPPGRAKYSPYIRSLKIFNPYKVYIERKQYPTGWSGFYISKKDEFFRWYASNSSYFLYPPNDTLSGFVVKSKGVPGIVNAEVWGEDKKFSARGVTVAPVPEPITLSLLLTGFASLVSYKKVKNLLN